MSLVRANNSNREERMVSLIRNYTYPQSTKQSNGTKVIINTYTVIVMYACYKK